MYLVGSEYLYVFIGNVAFDSRYIFFSAVSIEDNFKIKYRYVLYV